MRNCLENRKLSRLYDWLSITAVMSSSGPQHGKSLSYTQKTWTGTRNKEAIQSSYPCLSTHSPSHCPEPSLTISVWFIKHALCGDIVTIVNPPFGSYFQCCVSEADILARAAVSVSASTISIWRLSAHLAASSRQQQVGQPGSAGHICSLLSLQSTHLAAEPRSAHPY